MVAGSFFFLARIISFLILSIGLGCGFIPEPVPSLPALIEVENQLLSRTPEPLVPSDPYRIVRLGPDRMAVLLRGSSEVLLLDRDLSLLDRQPAPRSSTGLIQVAGERLFICGTGSGEVWQYAVAGDSLTLQTRFAIPETYSLRDLAFYDSGNALFLLDDFDRNLVRLSLPANWRESGLTGCGVDKYPLGAGPLQIQVEADHLIINLLLEHRLIVLPLKGGDPVFDGVVSIPNDGNFWRFQTLADNEALWLAAGGIENHALVRTQGGFGFVDSFLYLFRLTKNSDTGFFGWREEHRADPRLFQRVNLSEINLVTPKALVFQRTENGPALWVVGFGSDRLARFVPDTEGVYRPDAVTRLYPGINDLVLDEHGLVTVNPLLDRIETWTRDGRTLHFMRTAPVSGTVDRRMGELLLFTTLIAPHNQTREGLSRFTCEACHFEGGQDGRVHFTGRGEQHAVARTLKGLAENVPLFSGAGDDTLAKMILAEFEVANQDGVGRFSIHARDYPWLAHLGDDMPEAWTPTDLRRALLAFLLDFELEPNPVFVREREWGPLLEKGLTVFRDRCADCHQALVSNRTEPGLPFSEWRETIMDPDRDLIWGAPFYSKTGIRPYFDPGGTRVPSLRRIWRKYPYFTNGSATSIREVLERFRYDAHLSLHALDPGERRATGPMRSLDPAEIDALEALLRVF